MIKINSIFTGIWSRTSRIFASEVLKRCRNGNILAASCVPIDWNFYKKL